MVKFPQGFLWGSATSAYQVEGGIENCDWSKVYPAGIACDHYNRYEKDFDLAKSLNQNAHRFSIEWSRIEPREGEFDQTEIEHYRKVLLALRKRGIKSIVTLWHWTNPVWLAEKGGWTNQEAVNYFARYVKKIAEELGGLIDFWVTLNEPMVHIAAGYIDGRFPPRKKNLPQALRVLKNLIKAHKSAYGIIHAKYPLARVSIAQAVSYFEPASHWCPLEILFADIGDYLSNRYFLLKVKNQLDYLGLNYYFHNRVVWYPPFVKNLNKKITDIGWEIYPEGIYHILKNLSRFKKPIYILENGLADAKDEKRKKFMKDHLHWIGKAVEEGIDCRGYFHWSLMDNFEWEKGFSSRFGLVEMNYKTLERKPRPSAFYYAKICKENQLEINS
ncbi:MAG: hypothetical protein A2Z88_09710 [Omnitrophica WOR_2 bacterium GWA2_47_8]|nr:MAG: hypothetical protein A2Z88_09710 [Omnitrophica WOR_2 bacterium GWA2_47_8]